MDGPSGGDSGHRCASLSSWADVGKEHILRSRRPWTGAAAQETEPSKTFNVSIKDATIFRMLAEAIATYTNINTSV